VFGIAELKERIRITETRVECPVKSCIKKVERQRKLFRRDEKYKCPIHKIYISPSTFEYQSELDNLLWKDKADLDLLNRIKPWKRESRMSRDNSEDAVSWNVFRFLERNNVTSSFLGHFIRVAVEKPEIIYWSYSQLQNRTWDVLEEARRLFEWVPVKGSEPDIIILGGNVLVVIEVKLTATNKTKPSNYRVQRRYEAAGSGWWSKVFTSGFKTVAITNKKYELSRFWLVGTWMAKQLNLDFYLINLVLARRDRHIEGNFKMHIKENKHRRFLRITWEDIYNFISNCKLTVDKNIMVRFFKNKTIGYNGKGRLKKAFSLP